MHANGYHPNGNGSAVLTFAEVRRMARWLGTFTAADLAGALRVDVDLADQFVVALLYHDLCEDTGEVVDGPMGAESVYEMHALPEGPSEHPHGWDPIHAAVMAMGGYLMFDRRGLPVRLVDHGKRGTSMALPGERHRLKQRELAFRRQERARMQRAERDRQKAIAASQEGGTKRRTKLSARTTPTGRRGS